MKKISVLLALVALFFVEAVFANAVATTVTGSVQVIRGTSPARVVRQGDELNQGDTVFTGPNSSIVMKFDDGQVAALTASSRMTITAYEYNPERKTGNVLLSLIDGGMRAITGLIGKNNPERVSYRAATATIGIRGTYIGLSLRSDNLLMDVFLGIATFQVPNFQPPPPITAGNSLFFSANKQLNFGPTNQIHLNIHPLNRQDVNGLQGLQNAINQAGPGEPRSGKPGSSGNPTGSSGQQGNGAGGPTGGGAGGGNGNTTASPH